MKHITPIPPKWDWERAIPPAPAVRSGNLLFLSGQIPLDAEGNVVGEGDLTAQSHRCFQNIEDIISRAGGTMLDIVKMTTYFACELTPERTQEYWAVRRQYFGDYKPASTGLQVSALIYPSVMLEIEATAVLA